MASHEEHLGRQTELASGDLSASQYCFVKYDSNGRVAVCGADDVAIGVLQDKPSALGRACNVATSGVTKVLCGGSINAGSAVGSDASGRAVSATSGDINIIGFLREASGGSGEIHPMFIQMRGTT